MYVNYILDLPYVQFGTLCRDTKIHLVVLDNYLLIIL